MKLPRAVIPAGARDYWLFLVAHGVSALGSSISWVALPLLVLAETGSPVQAGLISATASAPVLLLSLPAGAMADRVNRRWLMLVCDAARALIVASIAVAIVFDALTLVQLYVVAFLEGVFFVFFDVAATSALPPVVGSERLRTATGRMEALTFGAALIGPPMGGFAYQVLGRAIPFVGDAVSYLASFAALAMVRAPFQSERETDRSSVRTQVVEGLVWLWREPQVRLLLMLSAGVTIAAGQYLVVIVAAQNAGADPASVGLIFGLGGVGGVIGSLLAERSQARIGVWRSLVVVAWMMALLWLSYAIAAGIIAIALITFGLFLLRPLFNVVMLTYRLVLVPDRLQGRITGAFRLVVWTIRLAATVVTGLLLELIGASGTVVVIGLALAAVAVLATASTVAREARAAPGRNAAIPS